MSRIQACFAELAKRKRTGLIPYLVGGDPTMRHLPELLDAAVESGADLIEVGVPFSDPMADGPSIQRGHERALAQGASLSAILTAVKDFRQRESGVPLVLMSYTNPIEARGRDRFVEEAVEAGIDGVLLVDLPHSERPEYFSAIKAAGIDPIFLVSPNTEESRVRSLAGTASGYIYYVSLKGVTGADHINLAETAPRLNNLKRLLPLPVAVGFGIREPAMAAALASEADAVIVGSDLVDLIGRDPAAADLARRFGDRIAEFRTALDA